MKRREIVEDAKREGVGLVVLGQFTVNEHDLELRPSAAERAEKPGQHGAHAGGVENEKVYAIEGVGIVQARLLLDEAHGVACPEHAEERLVRRDVGSGKADMKHA